MIPPVKQVLTKADWELYLNDGKLLLKFKGIPQVFEFRRQLALEFSEELQTLLRPFVFSINEEGTDLDLSKFTSDQT